MDTLIRLIRMVSQASGLVAAALIAASTVIVCQMVIMRYFLGASTIWQTEFVTFAIVGATFIGAPYVLLHKGHVNVDLVPHYISHRWRVWLAVFGSVLSLAFCLTVAWFSWEYFYEAWSKGWRTETVWAPPLWTVLVSLPIGMSLISLQYIADICCLITGREAPFGMSPEEGE